MVLNIFSGKFVNAENKFENDYWGISIKELVNKIENFTTSSNSSSEVINDIKVQGNNRISLETIIVFGDISVGKNYEISENHRNV